MHTHKSSREQHFPWQVLIVLNIYRLVVLLILLFIYLGFVFNDKNVFASSYLISSIGLIYLLFAVYCLFKSLKRKSHFNKMAILGIFIDILFFTFLIFMNQNLFILYGILMNIIIAAGSVIVAGRMSLLFAAWASICVLAIEVYISWVSAITLDVIQKTGFLCSTFFVIAIIAFSLSKRIRESEQLAQKQEDDIAALERINALIVQNMEPGVLVIDDEDRIVVSNKSAWYLLGTAYRAGKPMLVDVSHRLMSCVQAWREGTQESVVIGQLLEVGLNPKFTALTDSDGQRKATLIIIEDAVELSKQAQQIKLASLGRLTASIAHEIRNPLSAISHAAQLMDERIIEPNDSRLMDIIKNNSRRVNDIIESMLQLSRRKASVPERIHLRSWLSQFIHAFIGNYNVPVDITLSCEVTDPIIMFDSNQLQQVLENICDNGILYSKKATGRYQLQFCIQDQCQTGKVYLDIQDAGKGIAQEDVNYIFEPFYTTKTEGTGLGLYIARELCQANGARITYLNAPEKGSCFRILFK